ncbi:hypothetical protein RB195_015373 [Necator americanus]|uniref:Uncharacterized protein n=1 Tax=Necator americanus TaxID=51031 RepID=A0ABR1E634_NECAM
MTGDCVTRQTPLLSRRPNIVNGEIPFCLPYICDDMSRAVTELSTQRVSAERRGVIEIPSANLNCQLVRNRSDKALTPKYKLTVRRTGNMGTTFEPFQSSEAIV